MLKSKKVEKVFVSCLFKEEEVVDGKPCTAPVVVDGINCRVGFHPERIEENKEIINDMIDELPDTFDEGWTFINMCFTKDEKMWTGFHRDAELLLVLGMAIGRLEYCCDREFWNQLPQKLPYVRRIPCKSC